MNKEDKAAVLKYEPHDDAPVIKASGKGYVANKILEAAKNHNLPIVKNKYLAKQLVEQPIGTQIPEELFQAVAEIYAFFVNIEKDMTENESNNE